jgi:pilus assembly protein CpaF
MGFIRRIPAEENGAGRDGGHGERTPSELRGVPFQQIKDHVQERLIRALEPSQDLSNEAEMRKTISDLFERTLAEEDLVLTRSEKQRLFELITAEILAYGPIQPLIDDEAITEIMVNGPFKVYYEREGRLYRSELHFQDTDHLMRIIERIVAPIGRRVDESNPFVDARLPDGSRVNVIIPPLSLVGPVLTIRKFFKHPITADDLVRLGTSNPEVISFLDDCVRARTNILISGGTGSGKTTLLNVLSGFIPSDERIITIEDSAELQLRQEHVVTLESRPPNIEGKGQITIRQLVINALRMRPDRIIVGEIRDEAALDMLQAMNTGHDGSMSTAHSNSARDTLSRLETMALMSGMELPMRAIREQIASALDLIVHLERMRDGSRKIVAVTEVTGLEDDEVQTAELFRFEQTGFEEGKVLGDLVPTGRVPGFAEKFDRAGIALAEERFRA